MKKVILVIFHFFLFFSATSFALNKEAIENRIIENLGKNISKLKTPDEALKKLQPKLNAKETAYLKELISKKLWVEMPAVSQNGNTLELQFSNNLKMSLEISNPFLAPEFKLNGYQLETKRYESLEEKISYLRRVVNKEIALQKNKKISLFSLFFPVAKAANALEIATKELACKHFGQACMEVSVAASVWLAQTSLELGNPITSCMELKEPLRSKSECLNEFKNSHTLKVVSQITEILAESNNTSFGLRCNESRYATIIIDDIETEAEESGDYLIAEVQKKTPAFGSLLPKLANECCENRTDDPLRGTCEKFVNSKLGPASERKSEFGKHKLQLKGKHLEGAR